MFNLQQKYKKTFHKMQNQGTNSLETPLRYHRWTGGEPQGTERSSWQMTQKEKDGLCLGSRLGSLSPQPSPLCPPASVLHLV